MNADHQQLKKISNGKPVPESPSKRSEKSEFGATVDESSDTDQDDNTEEEPESKDVKQKVSESKPGKVPKDLNKPESKPVKTQKNNLNKQESKPGKVQNVVKTTTKRKREPFSSSNRANKRRKFLSHKVSSKSR